MNATVEKLFQPDGDGPDVKLEYESAGGYGYLYVRERTADGWNVTGTVETHVALPTTYSGVCGDGKFVLEWEYTNYHAAGDRTRVSHRLRLVEIDSGVVVIHELERTEVLGVGRREEHDWRERERWTVTPDGVRYREVAGDGR